MQPYFFPYFLYWRMIANSDKFIIYDDVNYINRGFISKNYIYSHGGLQRLTLNVRGASQNKRINEVKVYQNDNLKMIKTIRHSFCKAPQYNKVLPLIESILLCEKHMLSEFLENLILNVCSYLQIRTEVILSSSLPASIKSGKGVSRLIDICRHFGQDTYVNLPGGRDLYKPVLFSEHNISLLFMNEFELREEANFNYRISNLSIIQLLMYIDQGALQESLYEGIICGN